MLYGQNNFNMFWLILIIFVLILFFIPSKQIDDFDSLSYNREHKYHKQSYSLGLFGVIKKLPSLAPYLLL